MCRERKCCPSVRSFCTAVCFCWAVVLLPVTGHTSVIGHHASVIRRQLPSCEPGMWAPWGDWSECRATCKRERSRQCRHEKTTGCLKPCSPGSADEFANCSGGQCCPHGVSAWGQWGTWGLCPPCSKHRTVRTRTRPCQKNLCNQPCGGDSKATEVCATFANCSATFQDEKKQDSNNNDYEHEDRESSQGGLSVTLKALLGLFLTLLTLVVATWTVVIVHKKCRKKKPRTDEAGLEVIDINLSLPRLLRGSKSKGRRASLSSLSSRSSQPSTVVSQSTVKSAASKSSVGRDDASSAVDLETSSMRSGTTAGRDDGPDDIYYHAPGFYYD